MYKVCFEGMFLLYMSFNVAYKVACIIQNKGIQSRVDEEDDIMYLDHDNAPFVPSNYLRGNVSSIMGKVTNMVDAIKLMS
jgi:hypothetical protein